MASRLHPSAVAALAARWLDRTPGEHYSFWIYTASRETGIDVTRRVAMAFRSASERFDIPEDTLPTRLRHFATHNEVYVMCQPNHVETVLASMHAFPAAVRRQMMSPLAAAAVAGRPFSDETDFFVTRLGPEDASSDGAPGEAPALYVRKPSVIVVDTAEPDWAQLATFVGGSTEILQTERVAAEHSLERELARRRAGAATPAAATGVAAQTPTR